MATPTPINNRPAMTFSKVEAIPVRIAPAAATSVKMLTVLRGPQLSASNPDGNCMIA